MKLPTLGQLVKNDQAVYFSFYRDGEVWYRVEYRDETAEAGYRVKNFEFPIPPEDLKGALFKAEDRAIVFMRFIRKHLEFLKESMKAEQMTKGEDGK